jgi:hypothetical protein
VTTAWMNGQPGSLLSEPRANRWVAFPTGLDRRSGRDLAEHQMGLCRSQQGTSLSQVDWRGVNASAGRAACPTAGSGAWGGVRLRVMMPPSDDPPNNHERSTRRRRRNNHAGPNLSPDISDGKIAPLSHRLISLGVRFATGR